MADAAETAHRHAQDVVKGNMAGVMGDLTPEALTKAMALGGGPQGVTGYDLVDNGADGDDHMFDITYHTAAGSMTITSRWRDTAGAWKIVDLAAKQ
jgi:hypothetical protein